MTNNRRTPKEIRTVHNRDLVKRMQAGEALNSYDNSASWFPPRPIPEKDAEAVRRLYGQTVNLAKDLPLPTSVLDLACRLGRVANPASAGKPKLKQGA